MKKILLRMSIIFCVLIFQGCSSFNIQETLLKAEQGDVKSQFSLAVHYDSKGNYSEALKWYGKAADQGHSMALNNLGSMYQLGQGVKRDIDKALDFYGKAGEKGNGLALGNMAIMYEEGEAVPEDNKKAFELYTKAAECFYVPAFLKMGMMYVKGEYVQKDNVKAYSSWLTGARIAEMSGRTGVLNDLRFNLNKMRGMLNDNEIEHAGKEARNWIKKRIHKMFPAPEMISGAGFSLPVPRDEEWARGKKEKGMISLGKGGAGDDETYALVFAPVWAGREKTKEELKQYALDSIGTISDDSRHESVSNTAEFFSVGQQTGVVVTNIVKDKTAVRYADRKDDMLLKNLVLVIANPYHPDILLTLNYSHRYYPGNEDGKIKEKAEKLFNTLVFSRLSEKDLKILKGR